ncbi:uncharacterized protein BT62DRAFT_1014040 [Guyanagaster necrorhizus]|uniref:Uncharacterized protein n=1 Tax=Guyanagaster necrorhizus TaxID=856835 RepID=A0A9P7VG39_9AGAR|nr:uncharacterized protein BT62DRAFT_1014040 [Guyanagaster necrorhizus MCA 3950]KAG7439364.1 hypothetical protein BT62DRAFT_1014040 [Guyanagaster necrorhizus MCA 3950]
MHSTFEKVAVPKIPRIMYVFIDNQPPPPSPKFTLFNLRFSSGEALILYPFGHLRSYTRKYGHRCTKAGDYNSLYEKSRLNMSSLSRVNSSSSAPLGPWSHISGHRYLFMNYRTTSCYKGPCSMSDSAPVEPLIPTSISVVTDALVRLHTYTLEKNSEYSL